MAQILPQEYGWGETFSNLGKGITEGYMNASDQKSIQKAINDLGDNPSPQAVLKALTNTKTYSPESKQQALKNYMGAAEFEQTQKKFRADQQAKQAKAIADQAEQEVKTAENERKQLEEIRHHKEIEDIAKEKNKIKSESDKNKKLEEAEEVKSLYKLANPGATEEEIAEKTKNLKPADVRPLLIKPENVTEYEVAKNHAKGIEPLIKGIREQGHKSERLIIPTEAAIVNNEKYTTGEKYWDAAIDLADNKFLNLLKTQTGQQLASYTPLAIATFSDKMAGVLSVKKINVIEKKAAGPDKDKNANRLFLFMDLYDRKLDVLMEGFTNEILSENKYGLPPKDFQKKLDAKMLPYRKEIDEDLGRLLKNQKPKNPISQIGLVEKKKAGAKEDEVFVIDSKGREAYIKKDLLGTKGYEDFKKYD